MIMRCFIAFDVPDHIKDKLYDLRKELHAKDAKIKWVEKKNYHLTIKFLGNINENRIKEIDDKLEKISLKSFKTNLGHLGVFPSDNLIRVIFIELNPAGDVIKLQQMVDSELISIFPKDERFHNHITLGRVKIVKDKDSFLDKIKNIKINGSFDVKEFKFFKSALDRNGPTYELLKTYSLG